MVVAVAMAVVLVVAVVVAVASMQDAVLQTAHRGCWPQWQHDSLLWRRKAVLLGQVRAGTISTMGVCGLSEGRTSELENDR